MSSDDWNESEQWRSPKALCTLKHAGLLESHTSIFRKLPTLALQVDSPADLASQAEIPMKRIRSDVAWLFCCNYLSFPFKRLFIGLDGADRMMENLAQHKPFVSHSAEMPHGVKFCARRANGDGLFEFSLRCNTPEGNGSMSSPYVIVHGNDEYEKMDAIGDVFTEDQRLSARRKDQQQSVLAKWYCSSDLPFRVLQSAEDHFGQWTTHSLREAMYHSDVREPTQFKPSLALSVYQLFNASSVLDFSAGWGDRLLAALAHGVSVYCGYDPNIGLKAGHDEIMKRYASDFQRVELQYVPFESIRAQPEQESFDLVFTSPPFFDFEVYTSSSGQSVDSYLTIEAWLGQFLLRCLCKSWNALQTGGRCVVHLSDPSPKLHVCEPLCLMACAYLPGCAYGGVLLSRGAAGRPRPMWVFQKIISSAGDAGSTQLDPSPCEARAALRCHYPCVAKGGALHLALQHVLITEELSI